MKSFTPHIRQTTMEKEESGGGDAGQQPASQPGRNTAATLTRSPEGRARAGDTPGKTWYPARGEALWGPEHACPTAEGDTSKNSSRLRDVPLRLYPHSHLRGQPAPAPPPSSWALGTQRPRMQGALKWRGRWCPNWMHPLGAASALPSLALLTSPSTAESANTCTFKLLSRALTYPITSLLPPTRAAGPPPHTCDQVREDWKLRESQTKSWQSLFRCPSSILPQGASSLEIRLRVLPDERSPFAI